MRKFALAVASLFLLAAIGAAADQQNPTGGTKAKAGVARPASARSAASPANAKVARGGAVTVNPRQSKPAAAPKIKPLSVPDADHGGCWPPCC